MFTSTPFHRDSHMLTLSPFPDVLHVKKSVQSKTNSVGINLNHMQVASLGLIESWVYHCTRTANRMIEEGEQKEQVGNDLLTLRLHFGRRNGNTVLFTSLASTFPEAFILYTKSMSDEYAAFFDLLHVEPENYPITRVLDESVKGKIVIMDECGYHRHITLPYVINEIFQAGAAGVILS